MEIDLNQDDIDRYITDEPSLLGQYGWNDDPNWVTYVERFETDIQKMATKFCTTNVELRKDCAQNARIALLQIWPQRTVAYQRFRNGELTEQQFNDVLDAYCRQACRNIILSTINSNTEGDLFGGRTRSSVDTDGVSIRRTLPPRFSSLDELSDMAGLQIDEDGTVCWSSVSSDGLEDNE